MLCFLDQGRNCQAECVAFCGKDAAHPQCVMVNSISVLGLATSTLLRASQTAITHPKSAPPPEVKT
jgi:hypothetical protein